MLFGAGDRRIAVNWRSGRGLTAAFVAGLLAATPPAAWAGSSTAWVESHNAKVRLIAGAEVKHGAFARIVAGVEIRMAAGWKTYWRMPGDSGGIPPSFDWSGSTNVGSAKVLYPAPKRLRDAAGDTVGYTGTVVFPVEVTPKDPSRPVGLRLAVQYGICREICVPAEARLELPLPSAAAPIPDEIASALQRVPRSAGRLEALDPRLERITARLDGSQPKLVLEAVFPQAAETADAFIEAPDGLYVALPKKVSVRGDVVRFELDLTESSSPDELKGKPLLVTLVSEKGQSEAGFKLE
jgi:DsbC/DsbD-like thiol-disulfide interchange protein